MKGILVDDADVSHDLEVSMLADATFLFKIIPPAGKPVTFLQASAVNGELRKALVPPDDTAGPVNEAEVEEDRKRSRVTGYGIYDNFNRVFDLLVGLTFTHAAPKKCIVDDLEDETHKRHSLNNCISKMIEAGVLALGEQAGEKLVKLLVIDYEHAASLWATKFKCKAPHRYA